MTKIEKSAGLEDFGEFCLCIGLEQCFSVSLESPYPF